MLRLDLSSHESLRGYDGPVVINAVDGLRDSTVGRLNSNASGYKSIAEACMDGAYDSSKTYALLIKMGINPHH